jgi:hypothetical protein
VTGSGELGRSGGPHVLGRDRCASLLVIFVVKWWRDRFEEGGTRAVPPRPIIWGFPVVQPGLGWVPDDGLR